MHKSTIAYRFRPEQLPERYVPVLVSREELVRVRGRGGDGNDGGDSEKKKKGNESNFLGKKGLERPDSGRFIS